MAQAALLSVCRRGGLDESCILSTDGPAPLSFAKVFSLATDDVMLLSTAGEGATLDMADRLEESLVKHGIAKHADKDENDVLSGACVGVELVEG